MIYAPISPITLVLACLGFDYRSESVKPSNRRKNEVEAYVDQRSLQRRPKMTQQRQSTQKVHQTAALKKHWDRARQEPPRAARGDHHDPWWWDAQPCVLVGTAVRPSAADCVVFTSRLFFFLRVFTLFCLYNSMYLDLIGSQFTPIHSPFIFIRVSDQCHICIGFSGYLEFNF